MKLEQKQKCSILFIPFFVVLFLFVDIQIVSAAGLIDSIVDGFWGAAGWTIDKTFAPLAYLMWGISLGIGGLVTGIGGWLLDATFYHTILQMGNYLNTTSGLGTGIQELWAVIRDILNILFIFGLIHVGIKTIIDQHNSETHRLLGRLIVAALLVNFSLFITQVIVDFTNVLSVQIYNQIVASELTRSFQGGPTELGVELNAESIAGAFLQLTNVTTFFGGDDATAGMTNVQSLIFAIFTLFFLITAGLVFGLAAFLLISRFIALIIFMILSPVMFAGWIFPAFEEQQNKWWSKFIHYALFPPALLMMIYLALMVLNKMQFIFIEQNAGFTGVMKGAGMTSETMTLIMFFCIAIGFLYASIKIANSMGIAGAETSMHFLNEARGMAQSFAYRRVPGALLNQVVEQIDRANRNAGKGSTFAKMGNYGLRMITGGEQGRATIKKASNYGAGGHGREHYEHDEHERKKRAARGVQIHNIEHALALADNVANNVIKEKAMRDASSAQLIEMIEHHQEKDIINNAGLLSDSQFKAITDSDKVDDATKAKIASERSTQTAKRVKLNNEKQKKDAAGNLMYDANGDPIVTDLPDVIGKADSSELKAIGFDKMLENNGELAGKLSAKQIEDWKDLTPSEKQHIKKVRKDALTAEFNNGAGAKLLFERIANDVEISKLSVDEILANKDSVVHLNQNILSKIVENVDDATERKKIKDTIVTHYTPGNNPQQDTQTQAIIRNYDTSYSQYQADLQTHQQHNNNYQQQMVAYNALTQAQRTRTQVPVPPGQAPTAPTKTTEVQSKEDVMTWFKNNNTGRRF